MTQNRKPFKHFGTGNSLMEYAVPLVVFFGAGAIFLAMADVPGQMTAWLASSSDGAISGGELNIQSLNSVTIPDNISAFAESHPPQPGEELVCTTQGLCINLAVIEPGKTAIETAGGLGGEEISTIAQTFEQLAEQLAAAGADPALVDIVTRLASNGHDLGDAIKFLTNLCPAGNCNTTDINSIQPHFDSTNQHKDSFNQAFADFRAYLAANPDALNSLSGAGGVVNHQAEQIMALASQLGIGQHTSQVDVCGDGDGGGDTSFGGGDGDAAGDSADAGF